MTTAEDSEGWGRLGHTGLRMVFLELWSSSPSLMIRVLTEYVSAHSCSRCSPWGLQL